MVLPMMTSRPPLVGRSVSWTTTTTTTTIGHRSHALKTLCDFLLLAFSPTTPLLQRFLQIL
jgi:hypothetical protein